MNRIGMLLIAGLMLIAGITYAQGAPVNLAWDAPTTNTDGTALTDLWRYNILKGSASGNYVTNMYVLAPATTCAWTMTDGAVTMPTNYTVAYGSPTTSITWTEASVTTARTYFCGMAENFSGNLSDLCNEICVTSSPTVVYSLYWGRAQGATTNLVGPVTPSGGQVRYAYNVTAYPRSLLWFDLRANGASYSQKVAVSNTKPSPLSNLRVQ
jgi:hypothetical protein